MKFSLSRIVVTLGLVSFIGLGVFSVFSSHIAFAATTDTASSTLATVGDTAGLVDADPKIIVARLIRTALTLLGILVVCLILYGGFVWMTANGEAKKIEKAKDILKNAVIGLIIILMSWSITSFIISALTDAINGSSSGSSWSNGGYSGSFGGGGSSTSFTVTGFSPTGAVSIRNIVPRITFSKAVDSTKIAGNISIIDATGTAVPGAFSLATTNVIKFTPSTPCPTPNDTLFCFAENEAFTITVKSSLTSSGGSSLVCSTSSCSSTFTSGSLVDTQNPVANVLFPTSSISVNSSTEFQVQGTDDAGVAGADFLVNDEWQDSISAVGNPLETNLSTDVSTTGFTAGTTYTFKSTVTDIAGHEDSDTSSVRARPEWCFNGVLDSDLGETGVDCGGDSSLATFCGACNGSTCTTDSDCSEGSCVDGICTANPTISSVTPDEGAVGTYVTISGRGFGSMVGNVFFTDTAGTGTVSATILTSCGDGGWDDVEVLVQVPVGAGDGPITLATYSGATDKTDDDNGIQILNFDVNDVVSPSLCSLSSTSGVVNSALTLSGGNFGSSQGSSTISFGTTPAGSYTFWGTDGTSAKVTVPSAALGAYRVSMVVNGKTSNTLSFSITEPESAVSTITGISPSSGGIGQYVTITGTNFGSSVGTVTFEDSSGNTALGSILFPEACSTSFWTRDQVTIIVPATFQNGDPFTTGAYSVYVTNMSSVTSTSTTFTVNTDAPTPGICAITPSTGDIGDEIVIDGANFGSTLDTVTFSMSGDDRLATSWSSSEIKVEIPFGAVTGPVTVKVASIESNRSNITVGATEATPPDAVHAAYAWRFSTGDILDVPEVVSECTLTPEDSERISAVPNNRFSLPAQICVNAIVYAEFTTLMNNASVEDAISVQKCNGLVCSTLTDVEGTATALDIGTNTTSVTWAPEAEFDIDTTYKVTISTDAISSESIPLAKDVTWDFTTASTVAHCVVDRVTVSPSAETFTEEGQTANFGAEAGSGCVNVDGTDYTWAWSLDKESYVGFTGTSVIASTTLQALAEGTSTLTATVIAPSGSGNVSDTASVVVNFTDPYISSFRPNCTEACLNAEVSASFNTPMEITGSTGVEGAGNIVLKACTTELCTAFTSTESLALAKCTYDETDPTKCIGFAFTAPTLTAKQFYRVIVSGEIRSLSGVALIRTNYGSDFSWTFRVREDATLCAVERITMSPSNPIVANVGDTANFIVSAFGEADTCSVSGQVLTGSTYNWSWTNPIFNWDQTADPQADSTSTTIAAWANDGVLLDGSASKIVSGCTAECTPLGSEPSQSICGNSTKETGEECEDGNTSNSDGCSSSCLNEGSPVCASATDTNCCGNTTIETSTTAKIRENCDDGNTVSGDGCSSVCLAEGSASIGATCGNSDIAHKVDAYMDGETCDDGNNQDGDGCSRQCLLEGSNTAESLHDALCGDGAITTPYETCDDGGTVDGDGCSSTCIREGYAKCTSSTETDCCGNGGEPETIPPEGDYENGGGEDCDSTEGCTADCTFAGSSTSYANPSVCGDGTAGTGEYELCESGTGVGDGKIDPSQVAYIASGAVLEVDPTSHQAIADVTVTLSSQTPILQTSSHFALTCDAQDDTDCSDSTNYGVGTNNCCVNRPTFTGSSPASAETNVCRNAAINATFSEAMNLASFTKTNTNGTTSPNMYAVLNLASNQSCPSSYTTAFNPAPSSWFSKALSIIKTFFLGEQVSAAYPSAGSGTCILPITSYSQYGSTVSLNYGEALEPSASYTLFIEGDSNTGDAITEGVRSSLGAAMKGTTSISFTTGAFVCTLDEVVTTDTDTDSPNLFTVEGESHDFVATGWTHATSPSQEITSIPDVYSWGYSDWTSADTTIFTVARSDTETSAVTARGETGTALNGTTDISVSATIDDGVTGSEEGSTVSGNAKATAFLCENTWPALAKFPWSDDATGLANGFASELPGGYMNMAFSFCRDRGEADDTTDDLPSITPVLAPASPASDVLKEYLFEVVPTPEVADSLGNITFAGTMDSAGDAIGVRVLSNADYLSPKAWYESKGFTGSKSLTTVDGFEALTDGRTTYVAAANVSGTNMYSNIIAISYNESASDDTKEIYAGIIANTEFLKNVTNIGFCFVSGVENTTTCTADSACGAGGVCGNSKDKITRDEKRLEDSRTLATAVSAYGSNNRTCSATTAQTCELSTDCPGTETCEAIVPALSSGTDIRALSSSAWSSWAQTLGGAVGTIPADPLNTYATDVVDGVEVSACSAGNNTTTCVNEITDVYTCPANSYVYHYRAVGNRDFEIGLQLEYTNGWTNDIDSSSTDAVTYTVNTFCDDTAYGASSSCGDGIIGTDATTSSVEFCEIGDVQASGTVCDSDPDTTGIQPGVLNDICNSTCTAYITDSTAECVATSCGDGVINGTETCDDGSANGTYGHCSSTCSWTGASFCGDGVISGGEACDCGNTSLTDSSIIGNARPYGGTPGTCLEGTAHVTNGTYTTDENNSCAWDCQGPASYCGDTVVDSGEECDTTPSSWEGTLCNMFSSNMGSACSSDSDCTRESSSSTASLCGDGGVPDPEVEACPETTVCIAGDTSKIGTICTLDSACGSGGDCSTVAYQTYRTLSCNQDVTAGTMCAWNSVLADHEFYGTECIALGSCGDGVVDTNEECDDANDVSTDSCTNSCATNVCGDAYLNEGVEECDQGADNGDGCTSAYESTCTACSTQCKYTISSGEYCGDGEKNGDEYCDGAVLPYLYFNNVGTTSSSSASTDGTCLSTDFGDTQDATDGSSTEYTCRQVGICNGGDHNGEYCTELPSPTTRSTLFDTASCGTYSDGTNVECITPTCASDCSNTCPTNTTQSTLLMAPNDPGAPAVSSVSLYPYSTISTTSIPNAATMEVPACTVASTLIADIDSSSIAVPKTYVMIVTDTSNSMSGAIDSSGTTRLTAVTTQLSESLSDINSMLISQQGTSSSIAEDLMFGFVSFGHGNNTVDPDGEYTFSLLDPTTLDLGLTPYRGWGIYSPLDGYTPADYVADDPNPDLGDAVALANAELNAVDLVTNGDGSTYQSGLDSEGRRIHKVIILITDGQLFGSGHTGTDSHAEDAALDAITSGIDLYTLSISTVTSTAKYLDRWSSNTVCASGTTTGSGLSILSGIDTCSPTPTRSLSTNPRYSGTYPDNTNSINGIDYSYTASSAVSSATEEGIATAIQDIVKSAFGITITFQSGMSEITTDWDDIEEGADVVLPWPSGFVCDGVSTINVPMHLNYYDAGTWDTTVTPAELVYGTVNVSNVRMNMCSP